MRAHTPHWDKSDLPRLLVATEQITDPRFARAVIYLVRYDAYGAMGVVVNRALR